MLQADVEVNDYPVGAKKAAWVLSATTFDDFIEPHTVELLVFALSNVDLTMTGLAFPFSLVRK